MIFSLSRGSFYGSGRYSQHWTGDNLATWDFYKYGVSELLPFSLFGIPLVGNDLCGFSGDTTPELCARWLTYGAWMPFARNHNRNISIAQEPFAFGDDSFVLTASKKAYKTRYSHLKYIYSLFVKLIEEDSGFGVGTVMKPLWWEFPTDLTAYEYEDVSYMLGEDYLIAPILEKGDE